MTDDRLDDSSHVTAVTPEFAPTDFLSERGDKRELIEELRASWQEGHPVEPEELLARWPTNPDADSDVASLLFEDFLQRHSHAEDVSVARYEERFPKHKDSLAGLFRQNDLVQSVGGASLPSLGMLTLPDVGDEIFGFRLKQELGRGAFARVFLAGQENLAERAVVLKVSSIEGDEPQMLAQLQHTYIVPIYSVHEDQNAGIRAVCMPYFGGASLSAVLRACWADAELPRAGAEVVQALRTVQAPWPAFASANSDRPVLAVEPPALQTLGRLTYVQAAAWLVAHLAEGLHHAHVRGVLHRDIKSSNVLLGAEGEPMLLDFNLAQRVSPGQEQAHATLGGTIAYMAPEHLRALATRNLAQVQQVDQRADIYSLGMVLYEILTGRTPFDLSASYSFLPPQLEAMALERSRTIPSLRKFRPDVPWGLESIARKCLMPDVAARYQTADQLAQDLNALLSDQPLRFAPELSWVECGQKWLRRHPRVASSTSVGALAMLLLCGTGATLAGVNEHLVQTRAQLELTEARDRKLAFQAGTQRALCLVSTTSDVKDHLAPGQAVCEETLGLYDILTRYDWQEQPAWQRLTAEEQASLGEDARELLLLLAWARTRQAPGQDTPLYEALALLDRAEAIAGLEPSRALWEDRATYRDRLGQQREAAAARERARGIQPATARDYYLLASAWIRNGTHARQTLVLSEAADALTRALQLNPRHYWSRMQRGICYQELGDYTLAAADFGACVGLWPEFAWGQFNKGYVLDQSGRKREAVAAYTAALKLDPDFALALLNRGLAQLELKQYDAALADLERARQQGHDTPYLQAGRGVALEALGRSTEADAAFRLAFERGPAPTDPAGQRLRWVYGFAVSQRLPERAAAAFDEVLRHDSNQPQALYGRGMLLVESNLDEAIRLFGRALDAQPGFLEARRFRAILLARRGQAEAAVQDINLCLDRDRGHGATLYAAACVAARVAERAPQRGELVKTALGYLGQALAAGYGRDKAEHDPDLALLRAEAEFRTLMTARTRAGEPQN